MKSKLTRVIRFFAFQVIILLFALHVSGQSINGIEGTPTCPNCYGTTVIPTKVSSTLGISTMATDSAAFASGKGSIASGLYSTAFGYYSRALKHSSFAAGYRAKADSAYSVGLGYYSEAVNNSTFAFGKYVKASQPNSIVIGKGDELNQLYLNNNLSNTIMMGVGSIYPTLTIRGAPSTGFGKVGIATSDPQTTLDVDGTTRTDSIKITSGAENGYLLKATGTDGTTSWANPTSLGIWSINVNDYYYTNGNVGIGINPPTQKLDVNGTIKTTGFQLVTTDGAGKLLQSNANGTAQWSPPVWTKYNTNIYTTNGDEKVGIGISNPNEKLEIVGFVRTSEGYKVGTTQVINSARDYNGTNGTFTGILSVTGTGNSTFAGNVGIGVSVPTQRLDVNGTIKTTGLQLPNGSGSGKLLQSDGSGFASWVEPNTVTNWNLNGNIMNTTKIISVHNTGNSTVYGSFMIGDEFVFYGSDSLSNKIIANNYKWQSTSKRIHAGCASSVVLEDATGKVILNATGYGTSNQGIIWKTMAFTPEGKLGIGTSLPEYNLDVLGANQVDANVHSQNLAKSTIWASNPQHSYGFGVDESGNGHIYRDINWGNLMTFTPEGKVLIGDTATINGNYKLYVKGSILTTEVKIAMVGNWPDYVFKDNYKPMNLSDLETYINQNHHLPDVPSETEVKENGMNLAENDAMLLKKIEELTLYILQQGKKIENLETEIGKLKENK